MRSIHNTVDKPCFVSTQEISKPSSLLSWEGLSVARQSLWRLSSLDNFLSCRDVEKQCNISRQHSQKSAQSFASSELTLTEVTSEAPSRFRSTTAEVAFCFSMALTQLLAEYLISGFSVILPTLMKQIQFSTSTASNFWPASILSLILCGTILTFARMSDMYGGYCVFMAAVFWLFLWTFIAGFSGGSIILLDICRAMQGLAIAAYTPSTFALFGSIYRAGPRRNIALGIYGACAPLGFFAGICISSALPDHLWHWYFWIAAILAFVALAFAYVSIPADREDRLSLNLSMDWAGAVTITSGLILVAYALASSSSNSASWSTPTVLVPFIGGLVLLLAAVYVEAAFAASPLLPLEFFTPQSVKPFVLACLFFYGCFGCWLFTSTTYLQEVYSAHGMKLAAWFTPMAIGGFLIAATSGVLMHRIPPTLLLLGSGCAWVAAPLLLALSKTSAGYWAFPFPSMICGTLGIDLTFTISVVFLSSVSPLKYQGLAGAVSSILVNMGIAFSLSFAQIIEDRVADDTNRPGIAGLETASRAAFFFAAGSAAVGVIIVALFVRISRDAVDGEHLEVDSSDQTKIIVDSRAPSTELQSVESMV